MTSRHRRVLVAALVVAALLVGVFVGRRGHHATASPTPVTSPTPGAGVAALVPVGPTRMVAGVPVGWRHDRAGAAAAAAGYVAAAGRLATAGPISRTDGIRAMATATTATAQVNAVEGALNAIAAKLGGPTEATLWVDAPVTVTVTAYTDTAATVRVWGVSIIGAAAPDASGPQSVWRTSTVELVWESEDWKTRSIMAAPGPTPVGSPASLGVGAADFPTVAGWDAYAARVTR
jgi:hypothetical protein